MDILLSLIAIALPCISLRYGYKQIDLSDKRRKKETALAYVREAVRQYYNSLVKIHENMPDAEYREVSESLRAASYILQVTLPECAAAADLATMAALAYAESPTEELRSKRSAAMQVLAAEIAKQLKMTE